MCCLPFVKQVSNGVRSLLHPNATSLVVGVPKRFESQKCINDKLPKCTTEAFETAPCQWFVKKRQKPVDAAPQYAFGMKSMWQSAPCCVTCVEEVAPVRHDLLYLKTNETHFRERRYQRTWPQCPPRCLVPKKCYFDKLNVPEKEKRVRGQKNPDANMCVTVHECGYVEKYEKPCKANACKPTKRCLFKEPACCQKRCTMYPSYSECCAKATNEVRPHECACLNPGGLCEVNNYLRRMGLLKVED